MKTELSAEQILFRITAYCAQSEHCEADVREKLYQWGLGSRGEQDVVIDYLYDNNYLNAERYCNAFVHDKFLYQHWGKLKIKTMLQAKSLPRQSIEAAITTIDQEQYLAALKQVAQSKIRQVEDADIRKQKERLMRFLLSRGFEYDLVINVADEIIKTKTDDCL